MTFAWINDLIHVLVGVLMYQFSSVLLLFIFDFDLYFCRIVFCIILMGWSDDIFLDLPANHDFGCAICLEVVEDPVETIPCKHLFCSTCLMGTITSQMADFNCPKDRTKLSIVQGKGWRRVEQQESSSSLQSSVQHQLYQLRVKCPYESKGCMWRGTFPLLEDHLSNDCREKVIHTYQKDLEKYRTYLKLSQMKKRECDIFILLFQPDPESEENADFWKHVHELDSNIRVFQRGIHYVEWKIQQHEMRQQQQQQNSSLEQVHVINLQRFEFANSEQEGEMGMTRRKCMRKVHLFIVLSFCFFIHLLVICVICFMLR